MVDAFSAKDSFGVATSLLSPEEWIAQHRKVHALFWGPRDTRIPSFLQELTQAICTLRFSLTQLRLAFDGHSEAFQSFRQVLVEEQMGLHGADIDGHLIHLVDSYLSRIDWREHDVLEMMLDFLMSSRDIDSASLAEEIERFQTMRRESRSDYDRAVSGLISEARGNLLGLSYARFNLKNRSPEFAELNEDALKCLVGFLILSTGLPVHALGTSGALPEEPSQCWGSIFEKSKVHWMASGTRLPLKPFEKASLFLLEALPMAKGGHRGFVRYLIEKEEAYRRLLATCYAPPSVQLRCLSEEMERYNRLPEYTTQQVTYSEKEKGYFLYSFLLRPDVVAAIAEREGQKDIYRVISGLGPKAHLPRVLQEVQSIFGYVTPECFHKIVEALHLDPVDIICVIASYKQYSADPAGSIVVYLCKGTACFLRGQPELSRRLASEIRAAEGEVGEHGIQFIEMDCFGVCHLAPVIKARDSFLGKRTVEDVPRILEKLLKGPKYENRLSFLNRVQETLAPGKQSAPMDDIRIEAILDNVESPTDVVFGLDSSRAVSDVHPCKDEEMVKGCYLTVDASGQVYATREDKEHWLGEMMPHSLAFNYYGPEGSERLGCAILDQGSHLQALAHFPASFLQRELRQTIKPSAYVADGSVWMERTGGAFRLGEYSANVIAVEKEKGCYRLILLAGPRGHTVPEKDESLASGQIQRDEKDFLNRQDRILLGFAAETDPSDIESYLSHGGYQAVFRTLGLAEEPAWSPSKIIAEIIEAGLRGRGGAGFPTGKKWDAVRLAKCIVQEGDENGDEIKLIVANGDEGDPGAFMDRTLIEERPHQIIEGMILAAIAAGARYGVIYVRKEYEDAVRRLEHALFQARRKGFLGENIFTVPGLHFDLDIRLGAGAFVAGEKRAIMRAIEGAPAEPTLNAISNTYRGLWGKPTLLNNVETFANVPLIIQRGGSWYLEQGTERSGGSKVFSVAGIVKRTGLVEVRFGRTLNDIITICGGIQEGKNLSGVQIGGPSGAILSLTGIRSYLLHTPLDFDSFDQVGAMLGSGGLVFIGEDDDVVRLARHFTDWLSDESCGQCPACLQGTVSLGRTLDVILQGEGTSDHIHALWAKSDAIKAGSQCGLGMTAANPVTSALRFFPHSFLHHVLANPLLNRLECFQVLEALRLLTRENIQRTVGRRHEKVGYSFTLKKHLLLNLVNELKALDNYRPAHSRQALTFLDLLHVQEHEIGTRDLTVECSVEELEYHRLYLWDAANEHSPVAMVQVP